MIRNFYATAALLLATLSVATSNAETDPGLRGFKKPSITLQAPYLEPYPFTTLQTNIGLYLGSEDANAVTELYRSTNSSTGFQLIETFTEGAEYTDFDLKPRTTYYYRARATRNGEYSGYSYYSYTTESKWFEPAFSATANANGTVTISLTDRSYQETNYEILRNGDIVHYYPQSSDSGRVFTFVDTEVQPNTSYNYVVNATLKDEGSPFYPDVAHASVTTASAPMCSGTGTIEREKWTDVAGRNVVYIPTTTPPDIVTTLTEFRAPSNDGSNYGVRIRGYVCPPVTGKYIFFISGDDECQLFLSTNSDPANKAKIAYVLDHTEPLDWSRYPSQRSVEIQLNQGQLYYIEALHKELSGGDHLAVGWQLPNGTLERPIPGSRLIKFQASGNYPPVVSISSPFQYQAFSAPADVNFQINATDNETSVARVELWLGTTKMGEDLQAPYNIVVNDLPRGAYRFEARAYDTQNDYASAFVNFSVTAPSCSGTGKIIREFWTNIEGTSLSSVPFNETPQSTKQYGSFETDQYEGSNYGSRMKAYLCVPQTGNYTFWISSDDNSQLWLSTDDNPSNKRLIASVTGATKFREYTKYASQKSVAIPLQSGVKYYIEALHKEGTGNDFISVGWQLPDGTLERPIGGNRLITIGALNQAPVVSFIEPEDGERFNAGANILLRANASDPDGSIAQVQFEANNQVLNVDGSAPYEFSWNAVAAGNYQLLVRATDNQGRTAINVINIVVGEQSCTGTGKIYREIWTGVTGTSVSSIPVNSTPSRIVELSDFSTPNYFGNDYGSRIRGYLCVSISGSYTFFISSDDNSELWLSTDENPTNKRKIAYVNGSTPLNGWSKYPSQRSVSISLIGGRKYYIEALQKEGNGADHVSVAWQFQNGDFEGPIPGTRLLPHVDPATSMSAFVNAEVPGDIVNEASVFPNPVRKNSSITIMVPNAGGEAALEFMSSTGAVLQHQMTTLEESGAATFQLGEKIVPGMYFLKILNNRKQYVLKVQVE